jgi:BirA family biotin operon repressor/biotin-[acetyl-CoA-carboxylase] ligase
MGKPYYIDEILNEIVDTLKHNFKRLENKDFDNLTTEYEAQLFRKNKPSTFKDQKENLFSGYIQGVSKEGNLRVLLEDDIVKEFDLKEIQLLY